MDCSTALPPAIGTPDFQAGHIIVTCITSVPFDWHALIAPGVTVAGIVAAIAAAWFNIRNARELARRKATLDLIEKVESSEHYRKLTDAFSTTRRTGNFAHFVKPVDEASKATRGAILDYLNHYELVSIGIAHKILDAGIYRSWMEGAFVRDWNAVADWIQSIRVDESVTDKPGYDAAAFANYEATARSWSPATVIRLTASSPPLLHVDAPDPDSALPTSPDY